MYVIIWEYLVRSEHAAEFEVVYAVNGAWAQLFKKEPGYLGTELLHDPNDAHRYLTIDRWESLQAYETFLLQWKAEYAALDAQCEGLMEHEALVGKWEPLIL
jgi:heme-degrading monooxygenase HmoA